MKFLNQENLINLLYEEHDSCGIVAVIEKSGIPTHENMKRTTNALIKMNHRAGFIENEGDGAGILTDIPRKLWAKKLSDHNIPYEIAYSPLFYVAHIFIDPSVGAFTEIQQQIRSKFSNYNFQIVYEKERDVDSKKLGPNGRKQEPLFWQISGLYQGNVDKLNSQLFTLTLNIEENKQVHVASLSNFSTVYKVMGDGQTITDYYHDLRNPLFESTITIGHNRYSTNTLSHFFRVQPFSLLGHNGEINTIQRLRAEAKMLGIPLVYQGSDSQDLNRVIEGLIAKHGFSLFTAMELIFPPIYNEIKKINAKLQDLYTFLRHLWGPFSQGPAGIVSRYGNMAIFSVDALGLRPLWKVETTDSLYFSSEQGIVNPIDMVSEPKPLAPGEKVGILLKENLSIQEIPYHELQQFVFEEVSGIFPLNNYHHKLEPPHFRRTSTFYPAYTSIPNSIYLAFGWEKEHIDLAEQIASTEKEPIRSLGYDGPLAVLSKERVNLSDFLKETVAVVTNPAIDREREVEHFSTRMILGGRETLSPHQVGDISFEIRSPILLEGEISQQIVEELGTTSLEQTIAYFSSFSESYVTTLSLTFNHGQSINKRLKELNNSAIEAVKKGAKILILDDQDIFLDQKLWLDPHLAVPSIDLALKDRDLRRNVSIIIRSGAIRHLHDLITIIGLGADAVSPYLLFATVSLKGDSKQIKNLYYGLNKGIEKIISTIGIHELRGYERLFSSIGLHSDIAAILEVPNFYGSDKAGYSIANLEADALARHSDFTNTDAKVIKSFRILPRVWKSISEIANGSSTYQKYKEKLEEQENENPVAIRHVIDFKKLETNINPEDVNIGIHEHDLPFVISSMSFGSQNETAFRAYAEAAYQLNMMSLNGEGGEIKDMLGKYPKNRGMQIASGRFGVNIELINSSNWIEIKVGQGAKPGEGGHLPGTKVSVKVAEARNAKPGVDLISPSNNHDVYSIEDLAQIISELKTANKLAKIIVKVPVVPNIGTIAVGIAKAGADVISLSGYDGGTGAARVHALQYVGLPVEIGVKLAHLSLTDSGLRPNVEIWADGGLRSGKDVVKMILLGANRVGFGTLAMIAIGCTSCRGCHLDTCHVGISTQIDSITTAKERGLKRFVPRDYQLSVENLIRLFTALAEETKQLTAELGAASLQELVGRSDLLIQSQYQHLLDLTTLLIPVPFIEKKSFHTKTMENDLSLAVGYESIDIQMEEPTYLHYDYVNNTNRMLGSYTSGERVRGQLSGTYKNKPPIHYVLRKGSIPGNGLAAYLADGVKIEVLGGAQDGMGKTAYGGKVSLIKVANKNGFFVNGSVGKSCCYGAQKGLFIIQGNADSRAGIRLSGADIIIGGEINTPLQDQLGSIGTRANIKGFAFEYMTNGRAVVLGDPGPWICSGMTGGVIYQRIIPELGLDRSAIERRIAKGAKVKVVSLDQQGVSDLTELLHIYAQELIKSEQQHQGNRILELLNNLPNHFVRIVPESVLAEPSLLTE